MTKATVEYPENATQSQQKKQSPQAEKSANTRRAILEAAIQCIIQVGFARCTTSRIAEYANVSRGALMHHFPSRKAVLRATIKYLNKKQIAEYRNLMEAIEIPTKEMSREKIAQSVEEAWNYVNLPSSLAYQEILMASRTNAELKQVLEPLEKDFENSFLDAVKKEFPPWAGRDEIEVAHDAALFMLTGMMLGHMKTRKEQRRKYVMEFLTNSVANFYQQLDTGAE